MRTYRIPLSFALLLVLSTATAAPAAIELILNGGFESDGAGWTFSNVVFTDSYDMAGNENPPITARTGSRMAVLSGTDISLDASLSQDVDFSNVTTATLSFWLQLEADDISLVFSRFIDNLVPEIDFLQVYSGADLIYSEGLDDFFYRFGFGAGDSNASTQTGWFQVTPTISPAQFGTNPLTIKFNSVNASDPNGAQNFVAYIDDVSLMVEVDGVIPEPTPLLVWSGLGLIGLLAGQRRTRG